MQAHKHHTHISYTHLHRNLAELLDNFVSDMKSRGGAKAKAGGAAIVIPSAADMFVFYKKCLVQCASLSTGPPTSGADGAVPEVPPEYAHRVLMPYLPK